MVKAPMRRQRQRTKRVAGKKRRSKSPARAKQVRPQTVEQLFALSERFQDIWTGITQAISKMRADRAVSLPKAASEFGVTPRQVLRLGRPALRKGANGRWTARARDTLLRVLVIPMREGLREIAVRDSRQATTLAMYWIAVGRFLTSGDVSALREFRGVRVTDADGKKVQFLTNPEELERLASAGEFSFESIYARAA